MTQIVEIREARKNQFLVDYLCDYCGASCTERKSHFDRKKRRYCNQDCYSSDRRDNWQAHEQPTWGGGVSNTEAHRRWKKKNPERMAHLKARYYARRKNADGSHTFKAWQELKRSHDNKCANCREEKPLTKDHIIPLSEGGSDYIENIQPLCRNCNSRKWKHIYENPELLEA